MIMRCFPFLRFFILMGLCISLSLTPLSVSPKIQAQGQVVCVAPTLLTGVIVGTVTAADTGNALSFVLVRAYANTGVVESDYTDQAGQYVLEDLQPGNYTLRFGQKSPYGGEWHENQPAQTTAAPIAVTSGTTTTIHAVLEIGGVISGVVTASDTGLPLADVTVRISDSSGEEVAFDTTDSQGQYSITGLTSGLHTVLFSPAVVGDAKAYLAEWYNDKVNATAADTIMLTAPNLTPNINAALARGGQISGTVTAADTGDGLSNIRVEVYDDEGDVFLAVSTDAAGNYMTSALPNGRYRILFETPGFGDAAPYVAEWYNDKLEPATADVINITGSSVTTGVDAVLTRGGAISGKVTAADMLATLTDTTIYVYNLADDLIGVDSSLDVGGVYTITGLVSGSYKVFFSTSSFGDDRDYLSAWYNGQRDEETADIVMVAAPNTTNGIDATLEKGGMITGRVTNETGELGLDEVRVTLYDVGGQFIDSTSTEASGHYTATQLATGAYLLEFEPSRSGVSGGYVTEWYDNKPDRTTADSVTVTAPNRTANIDAALAVGSRICGKVTGMDSGVGLEDIVVDVYDATGRNLDFIFTDAAGNYVTSALPGSAYKLEFHPLSSSPAYAYMAEWHNDKPNEASADVVTLTAPNVDAVVNVVLQRGGQITGKVTLAGSGLGVSEVDINVNDQNDRFVNSARIDATGVYTTPGLPTGSYKLQLEPEGDVAVQGYALEWYNDKTNEADANLVAVTAPNLTRNIDFVLAPGGRITGRVTAAETNVGLEFASVFIYEPPRKFVGSVSTDENGVYLTPGLRNGSYKLRFSRASYAGEWYNGKPDDASADTIVVTAPATVSDINAVLDAPVSPPQPQRIYLPVIQK